MRGLAVDFNGDKASIDFNSMVQGFWPTVQNTTVSIGQKKKDDKIFPDKGSTLNPGTSNLSTIDGLESGIAIVASDLQDFTRSNDSEYNEHKLIKFKLDIAGIHDSGSVKLTVQAKSSKNETLTTTI